MNFTNPYYYDYLQVSPLVEPDVLENIYKKLVKKYHPDNHQGSTEAELKMKQINEAYSVLSDQAARKAYDAWLKQFRSDMKNKQNSSYSNTSHQSRNTSQDVHIDINAVRQKTNQRYKTWEESRTSHTPVPRHRGRKILFLFASAIICAVIFSAYDCVPIPKFNNTVNISSVLSSEPSASETDTINVQKEKKAPKEQITYTVTARSLNIRSCASSDGEILGKLYEGEICTAAGQVSEDNQWVEIILPDSNGSGWVAMRYLIPDTAEGNLFTQIQQTDFDF